MKQKLLTALLVLVAPLLALQSAQAFPDRPIKLVVPSSAGGPPDVIARLQRGPQQAGARPPDHGRERV
jgi:tripartite-type tricarboxylate transporter receptor subunit TctC